jgi:hypothetical protein
MRPSTVEARAGQGFAYAAEELTDFGGVKRWSSQQLL